jgi:hypothetical protein
VLLEFQEKLEPKAEPPSPGDIAGEWWWHRGRSDPLLRAHRGFAALALLLSLMALAFLTLWQAGMRKKNKSHR